MKKNPNSVGKTLLVLLLVVLFTTTVAFASGPPAELFTEATGQVQAPETKNPAVFRSRHVQVNLDALSSLEQGRTFWAESVVLNLFDDVTLTAFRDRVERRSSGSASWFGRIEGVEQGQVILVVRNGNITGNVRFNGNLIQVRPLAGGVHVVREIDLSAIPEDDCATRNDDTRPPTLDDFSLPEVPGALDDGSIIDVMTVYTAAARSGAGGTTQINDVIQLAVDETNQSYVNSGINPRIRLVHTAEVTYTEPAGSCSIYDYRNRLQDPTDGYMDEVHAWRNTYCADLVVLIVENGCGYCGVAYIMESVSTSFEDHGFAVAKRANCATGYYSYGHEMGHIQSARHDWFVDSTNNSPFTYNHGYVDPSNQWRTVMAYKNACGSCTRIQYWSNPDVLYFGDPMGVAEGQPNAADNRKTLNTTAWTVSNFRESCYQVEQPDLVVESIVINPEVPEAGQTIDVAVKVTNFGMAAAGSFWLDWYADRDTPPQPEKFEFGDSFVQVSSLAAGASYTYNFTYSYAQPGFYRMYAYADTEFQVEESNENNNDLGPQNLMVGPCECDLTGDGLCDMQDWLLFGQDWGRTDCYQPAPAADVQPVPPNDNQSGDPNEQPVGSAPVVQRLTVEQEFFDGTVSSGGLPAVIEGRSAPGGDIDDGPPAVGSAKPISERLNELGLADKRNATLQLEVAADLPASTLTEVRKAEALWNSSNFAGAIEVVKALEAEGIPLAVGISWKTPKAVDSLKWAEGDVRIGNRAEIQETHLDFDAETGNLFAVLRYIGDPNWHWSVNISTNNGGTWVETYEWWASYEIKDVSAAALAGYLYVGYVGATDFSEARIRRFLGANGSVDGGFGFKVVFDKNVAIKEIALASNADTFDNRIYYFAILNNFTLVYFWDNPAAAAWSELATGVNDAWQGLDASWNYGFGTAGDYFLYASYIGYIIGGAELTNPVVVLRNSGTWQATEILSDYTGVDPITSVSAYGDTVLCAYEHDSANGMGIRYGISYNGGDTWGAGWWDPDPGHDFYNPAVTARGGEGTAIVYDDEAGAFDPVWFRYRGHYNPGAWDAEVTQLNEIDGATAWPNTIQWLPPLMGSSYAFGAIYLSWDPDPGTPYFDRSDGEACECDLNYDGTCDMQDWLLFGRDWGRVNCPVPVANIALEATASSSGGGDPFAGFGPENMNDGQGGPACTMHWVEGASEPADEWIRLDWTTPVKVYEMAIDTKACATECGYNAGRNVGFGTVQWWDGASWVTDGSVADQQEEWSYTFSSPVETTAIRVYGIAVTPACGGQQSNPVIYEWYVYGQGAGGAADMLTAPLEEKAVVSAGGSPDGNK